MLKKTVAKLALIAVAAGLPTLVHATPADTAYLYQTAPGFTGGGPNGANLTGVEARFTMIDGQEFLEFTAQVNSEIINDDGFYLAINSGPNPKSTTTELAILFGDVANNVITAYQYDGRTPTASAPYRRDKSWGNPAHYLETFSGAITAAAGEISFLIDVTSLNNLPLGSNWTGVSFDEKIGIWFGYYSSTTFSYDGDAITKLTTGSKAWHDTANRTAIEIPACPNDNLSACTTTEVPEPGTLGLALSGLAILGAGAATRRRKPARA